jgi:signal transduction histidine kinase
MTSNDSMERHPRIGGGVGRLLRAFSRAAWPALDLPAGLAAVCREAPGAVGVEGASAWMHDRRLHELVLVASAGATDTPGGARLPADAPDLPSAALREDGARFVGAAGGAGHRSRVFIPLRGRRRALGVLVLEGMDLARGADAGFLAEIDEFGRQLSADFENLLLLEDVLRTRLELARSEKLASLGRFVAGIAHELNNPLQGVLGHLELLRREGRVPDGIRRELGIVTREADRAARIVGHLLAFAGGRPVPLRPLGLNALVSETVALRTAGCRAAKVSVACRLDRANPRVRANRVLLQQALLNILVNAEQALAERGGGRIWVSTHAPGAEGVVRLRVRDTGPGITADALPRLFEPFFSTKGVGRGTGLGLAIAYGTVKDHRGTLAAGNHPDGGAVFTIELPVVGAPRTAVRGVRSSKR